MATQEYPLQEIKHYDVAEYMEYVKHLLGGSSVKVELEEKDVDFAIQDALTVLSHHRPIRCVESWEASEGVSKRELKTKNIRGVFRVEVMQPALTPGNPNIEAQLMSGQFTFYQMGSGAARVDLKYYEYLRQWIRIAQRELSTEPDYFVEDGNKIVWIYSPGRTSRVTATLNKSYANPTEVPASHQEWFRSYIVAICKGIVGQARSKFASVPGAGSSLSLNGAALVEEGKTEKEALVKTLIGRRRDLGPIWG